eukprot:149964_1
MFANSKENTTLSLRRKQRQQNLQRKVRSITDRLTNRLTNICLNEGNDDSKLREENISTKTYIKDIPKYIANIMQTDSESLQLSGLIAIRKLVSVEEPKHPISEISTGVIPKIIQFMYSNNYNLAFESAWIITNIAASTSKCTRNIVSHGAINGFRNILLNNNFNNDVEIIIQSIWGLGNICADKKQFRDMVMISFDITKDTYTQLYNNVIWLINNIIRSNIKYLKLVDIQT